MKVFVDEHKRGMMNEATITSLVKNVADTLDKHYPGHLWAVGPSNDYSMLAIWNEALSNRYGMWIRVNDIDPEYKKSCYGLESYLSGLKLAEVRLMKRNLHPLKEIT